MMGPRVAMRRGCVVIVLTGIWLGAAPLTWATTYAIDRDHTTIEFSIRHLFSQVKGTFNAFEGQFEYVSGQPDQWRVTATIQADSIDSRQPQRDEHLRSKDFFHVEQFPTITFTSTEVSDIAGSTAKLHGLLTIHGIERPVVLALTIHGEGPDPWGNRRSGFTATTTINRKDFGLTWNEILETGQLLVGEEVEITLEVEGVALKG